MFRKFLKILRQCYIWVTPSVSFHFKTFITLKIIKIKFHVTSGAQIRLTTGGSLIIDQLWEIIFPSSGIWFWESTKFLTNNKLQTWVFYVFWRMKMLKAITSVQAYYDFQTKGSDRRCLFTCINIFHRWREWNYAIPS